MDNSQIVHYVQSLCLNSYGDLISMTVLFHDYLLMLPDEVEFVWRRRWNHITIFFLISRYSAFVDGPITLFQHFGFNASEALCSFYWQIECWFIAVGLLAAEGLLLFRTYAIWNSNKKMEIYLILFLVALAVPIFYIVETSALHTKFAPPPIKSNMLPGCFVTESDHTLLFMFALFLLYETVVFVLTLIKAIQTRNLSEFQTPIYSAVFRDGILFYSYLFTISVINIAVMLTVPGTPSNSLTLPHRVLHSVLTSRLVLHIRKVVLEFVDDTIDTEYIMNRLESWKRTVIE